MRKFKKIISVLLVAALVIPYGGIGLASDASSNPSVGDIIAEHGFEDGNQHGWGARGAAVPTVTQEVYYSGNGALLTTGRSADWHGPSLNVTSMMQLGASYEISGYVKLVDGHVASDLKFSIEQTGVPDDENRWAQVTDPKPVTDAEWVQLTGVFEFDDSRATELSLYLESSDPNSKYILDDFTIRLVSLPPDPPSEIVTVYHETFESSSSVAEQSGGANLSYVEDKYFDGNTNGKALYVSNRANDWDAADFFYENIGVDVGKKYTITVTGYVDEGVTIPTGSQFVINTVEGHSWVANVDIEAGEAFTVTNEYTLPADSNRLRLQSNEIGKSVPFYIGEILITAVGGASPEPEVPIEYELEVYHESFESGSSAAVQSGGANLEYVDKSFDGNTNGKALYVSNRANDYDAADFMYEDMNVVQTDRTYKVTVTGYVDEGEDIPANSEAVLITIDDYKWLTNVDYVAGETFTLTAEFTPNGTDRLRIQSNPDGAAVPFYIGDIRVTTMVTSEFEHPRKPALPFTTITFEDQDLNGFEGRNGGETLTITDEANHTEGGSYSLKIEDRSENWHGSSLRVEKYIDRGYEYHVSAWVKLISPGSANLQLSTQVGDGSSASYNNIQSRTVRAEDGWVQLEGTYRYNSVGGEYVTIYVESPNSTTASFYIDDISFVRGADPTDIERDLIPIKDVYANDFLIGNAVSAADLDGIRLELLNLHHNAVTAENAMKPDAMQPTKGNFTFAGADAIVNKAIAEGHEVFGHVLVWHQQSPDWMNMKDGGGYLTREEALANMRTHIQTVMEHYGDRLIGWDVVNEAMSDNPPNPTDWQASLRQSAWYHAIGPDYVEQAFLAAREVLDANPGWDVKLYYNDYNDDNQSKSTAIYHMIKEINERYAEDHPGKLLIDGMGMQAHYNLNTNPENVRLSLERFISLGIEVSVTELDITAGVNHVITEQEANAQAYLYAQLFKLYKEHADHIARVTLWGLNDTSSWRAENSPLVFDRNLHAKPAYYAIIDPDAFIESYDPIEKEAKTGIAVYGKPEIDGTIDTVWNQAPVLRIDQYQSAWHGATGTARILWDEENVYALIQVVDDHLDKSNSQAHEQDSVEVFVDENNAKTSFYQEDDGQYRVNFDNETSFNPASAAEGFESATQQTANGYIVELKIPFKTITPSHNTEIGFDLQINDATSGSRTSVAAWNDTTGTAYQDTSVFGNLTLTRERRTGGGGGGGGSIPAPQTGTVESVDGVTTIQPNVTIVNGRAKGTITSDMLNTALELATSDTDARTEVIVDLPVQDGVESYDVQLPTQSLQGQENFVLVLKTEFGNIHLPSNMLSNTADHEEISIRIAKGSTEHLDDAAREQIGSRPVIQLNLISGDEVFTWNNPEAPVLVGIPYTPTAEELSNSDHIVIWYIDQDGHITPIPNGRYNHESGMVEFRTTHFSTYAVSYVFKTFGDLQSVPWAKQAIDVMASRGVIKGTSDKSFSPAANIKRADFISLLVRALELQGNGVDDNMFVDVQPADYYYHELAIAKELEIAKGFDDHTFRPEDHISRQDMMVLTVRALAAANRQLKVEGDLDAYPDAEAISDYARESARVMIEHGIVIGKNGNIAPNDHLTRAEAAVILYRLFKL